MYSPTTRVLTILELLQSYDHLSGAELARRLEVDVRSIRRYITKLQDLGIPVESERGVYGAYHLRPGFKLPPLMFNEEEALALTLGLLVIRQMNLNENAPALEGALAKIQRVMPAALRERIRALQETLILEIDPVALTPLNETVVLTSIAVKQQRRVTIHYRAWGGEITEREIDPYRLIYREGRWYTVGYCHLRHGIRAFRLDRVQQIDLQDEIFIRPADFDDPTDQPAEPFRSRDEYLIEVLIETPITDVQQLLAPMMGTLESVPEGVIYRCYAKNLTWMAHFLVGLGWSLVIYQPPELREEMKHLAAKIEQFSQR